MSDIKWIKLSTDMFEDEKIDYIQSLPEADAIMIVWIRLLTMAGKSNAGGYILLTEKIPYTAEMLAHKMRKPITVINMAIEILKRLEMIDIGESGGLFISKWAKHQNVDSMDKVREQTRKRVAKSRERKKLLQAPAEPEKCNEKDSECNGEDVACNATSNVTVTQSNAPRIENKNKDIDDDDNARTRDNLYQFYQSNVGPVMTEIERQKVYDLIDTYPDKWIREVIEMAVLNKSAKFKWIDAVLKGWQEHGYGWTPWQKKERQHKNKSPDNGDILDRMINGEVI